VAASPAPFEQRICGQMPATGEIHDEADQHADAGSAESPVPAHRLAQRAADQRRDDHRHVDADVIDLKRRRDALVAGLYSAPTWLAMLPLKHPTPISRHSSASRNG